MSPAPITHLHSSFLPGPLWTCVRRRSGVRCQWWPSGGGNRTIWIWTVCIQRLSRKKRKRGRGDVRGGDGDVLNRWEDNVANLIFGQKHNAPLASSPVLELQHLIMSMLVGGAESCQRERDIPDNTRFDIFLHSFPFLLGSHISPCCFTFIFSKGMYIGFLREIFKFIT